MKFEQFEDLSKKTTDELFQDLILKALEGKQSDFEFIRTYDGLQVAKLYKRGVKRVVKVFNSLKKSLLHDYLHQVMTDEQSIESLMAIKQFEKCAQFYKNEFKVAKDMISEFKTYVFSGHILQTILGGTRPDRECVDYRKLPLKLW